MMDNLLEGIRILDFTNYLPGPFATLRLAEMGAEVIKVESLDGDPARHTGIKQDGTGIVYAANNRGKMSISIDLKEDQSREKIMRLMEKSDVILESFRPGVMRRFGLDYDSIRRVKPDIVYCSITGYGGSGSWSKLGSHDINYMGLSGMLAQLKDKEGRPVHPSITFADYYGSFAACERVLAALLKKERSGKGDYHCISITDLMISMMGSHLKIQGETGEEQGISLLNGELISYGIYETKDGRYMTLGALEPKFWRNFCAGVGRSDWIAAHFTVKSESNPVYRGMEELFSSRSFCEWISFSQNVDCCLAPVLEVGELENYPYFISSGSVYRNSSGRVEVAMHAGSRPCSGTVPEVGEHTAKWLV